jgi:site-specific DNA recombinase
VPGLRAEPVHGRALQVKRQGNPTVAVAYLRVSTEDQALGPEAQRAAIERWAQAQGVTVASWHVDQGVSGATPVEDRPALLDALAAVQQGAGILVAAKRDRIARDVVIAATVETMSREAGARVVTADGVSAEDTPEGMLMRTLMDAFAQYERALIRARTKAALAVKKARGERVGSVPFGFRAEGTVLVQDPQAQREISVVRGLRANGNSFRAIVAAMTVATGRTWHLAQLQRILR